MKRNKLTAIISTVVGMAAGVGIFILGIVYCSHRIFSFMSSVCQTLVEGNPEMEAALLAGLKQIYAGTASITHSTYLEEQGYHLADLIGSMGVIIGAVAIAALIAAACVVIGWSQRRYTQKRIAALTAYLEKMNSGQEVAVLASDDDDFALLEDELYKTVTYLRTTREQAVTAKMQFAENLANIAHQIKTPLTAAKLNLQQLPLNRQTLQMRRQLERLQWMEEGLLTLSEIDTGALHLKKESADVYTLLAMAEENLQEILRDADVSVEIACQAAAEITCDKEWTMEVLMNIIKNCIEHSPPGGKVHCAYQVTPLYTEVFICDNGKGFAEEDLPHVFERFYRGQNAVAGSAGIGLALAKAIMEMQNSTITVSNRVEGGACFDLRFYCH